jgi:arabinogalactan endo-1,4-beta-galactosidase
LSKGSERFLIHTFLTPLYGLRKDMDWPSGERSDYEISGSLMSSALSTIGGNSARAMVVVNRMAAPQKNVLFMFFSPKATLAEVSSA